MRKALNIFHQGKGGLESLSQNISSILKDYLNVESIPANSSFASVWRTAIRNEIILVHRTSSILKVFPILLFYPKIVIFFHHFMARKRKKDPYHRIIYSRVNKFVVLSKRIKQQVKQNWCIGEERVYVAYPGVDT
ncbi:MAG: glycosyltransferase, partial [Candidatus Pacearchaeota archaeon]